MLINRLFPATTHFVTTSAAGCLAVFAALAPARAQSYSPAPTPVYGATESQTAIRYRGPGLPGTEPQQSIAAGGRHAFFEVAGYEGSIYAPVTPPYNGSATYRTVAGQPGNGANAFMAQAVTGAP